MQHYHYITMLLAGLSLNIQLFLLFRYFRFRKRGITALNYCLLLLLTSMVFNAVTIYALFVPAGPLLEGIGVFISCGNLFLNTLFSLIVFNLSSNNGGRFIHFQKIILFIPVALTPVYLTNGWHHLIVTSVSKDLDDFLFSIQQGPLMLAITIYSTILIALAIVYVFKAQKKGSMQKMWIRWALVISTCLPAFFSFMESQMPFLAKIGFSLFSTWISLAIICYLFFGYLPTARQIALDFVDDAYAAFDFNDNCVDINSEGERFFLRYIGSNTPNAQSFAQLLSIKDLASFTADEIHLTYAEQTKHYRIFSFPLTSGINQCCGIAYVIHEITEFIDKMSSLNAIAEEDPLTGAKNRRYLEEQSHAIFARGINGRKPITVLMLDIDHFKKVNDTYGHPVGDEVLAATHHILQKNIRDNDFVVRYGGEEFLILYENMNQETGMQISERIRCSIAKHPFETKAGPIHITVSIGLYTSIPQIGGNLNTYVEKADEHLYLAKNNGRNQVWSDAIGKGGAM